MADNESSHLMWIIIVVAIAALIFMGLKVAFPGLISDVTDKMTQGVKGIDVGGGDSDNNGGNSTVSGINKVPNGAHALASNVNKPGTDVVTDASKYVESGETGFGTSDNGRWGIDANGNAYIWSSDDKPVMFNVDGGGAGEFFNTRANQDDVKSITIATTFKADTGATPNLSAATFGNKKVSVIDVTNVDLTGVQVLGGMFESDANLEHIDGLKNWNLSSVVDEQDGMPEVSGLDGLFGNISPKLKTIDGINFWKLSDKMLKNSPNMFAGMKYTTLPSWATDTMKSNTQNSMFE